MLRPESVKYCALLSGRTHGRQRRTYQWQEYDLHHVLQLLSQRDAKAALTRYDQASEERAEDGLHLGEAQRLATAKECTQRLTPMMSVKNAEPNMSKKMTVMKNTVGPLSMEPVRRASQ